jgi:hypothetical protein
MFSVLDSEGVEVCIGCIRFGFCNLSVLFDRGTNLKMDFPVLGSESLGQLGLAAS